MNDIVTQNIRDDDIRHIIMSLGIWQIVLIALLAILLFGRGRISDLMGDVAKGVKNFRKGLSEEEDDAQKIENEYKKAESAVNVTPEKQEQQKTEK